MREPVRNFTARNKMRDVIGDNNLLLMAISRFYIAFCFGENSIENVCIGNNVDVNTFLAVCNLLNGGDYSSDDISLQSLIGYLKRAHTSFLTITLQQIRHKLIEAINYTSPQDVAFMLIKFYDDYVVEVENHMKYENDVVFGYVEQLIEGKISKGFSISKFSVNHGHMAETLDKLKDLFIYHYNQKDNIRLSHALSDIIQCGNDLMSHFEVENRLFVPAVEQLEESLSAIQTDNFDENDNAGSSKSTLLNSLTDREKEIVGCVARGLANKEIADQLCLSVHTIKTHRRNICAKLGIHSSAGLTIFAILHNLVDLKDVNPFQ